MQSFCDNPKDSSSGMVDEQIRYYRSWCDQQKFTNSVISGNVEPIPSRIKPGLLGAEGDEYVWQTTDDMVKTMTFDIKTAAGKGGDMLLGFWQSMFTVEGMKMMGEIVAFEKVKDYTIESIGKAFYQKSVSSLTTKATESMSAKVAEGLVSKASVNLVRAAKVGVEATELAATLEGEAVITAACPPCGAILLLLDVIMFIGMILDIWDPWDCLSGTSQIESLDAYTLRNYSNNYNKAFRDNLLHSLIGSVTLSNGDVIINKSNWPVEYSAKYLYSSTRVDPSPSTLALAGVPTVSTDGMNSPISWTWDDLNVYYASNYLHRLRLNSINEPCYTGPDLEGDELLSSSNIPEWEDVLALRITNQNSTAAIALEKWWPILILLFLFILFVIIKLL
jgi:hypothetical protein